MDLEMDIKGGKVEILKKQLSEAINEALEKQKTARAFNEEENIKTGRLLTILCNDWNTRWKTCAEILEKQYEYEMDADAVKGIIRHKGIAHYETRRLLYKWAEDLSDLFIKALAEGNSKAFEAFKKKRDENIKAFDGTRLHVQDRVGIIMLFYRNRPLGSKNVMYRIDRLNNYICRKLMLTFTDILAAYCGAGISTSSVGSMKLSIEQGKRRIEELENELERTNMLLADLQEEFDARLEESQNESTAAFFARLNSEKYGSILDELMNLNKGIIQARKNGFQLPPEISGLFIIIQKMMQFVKDSGISPMMKTGVSKSVKLKDVEGCDYDGTPFENVEEEKEVFVLAPGWIFLEDGMQISRPKVKEVVKDVN